MNAFQVYFIGRPLEKGDIKETIGKFSGSPAIVAVSRFNEKFKAEVPDNIKFVIRGGLLKSEIWIADQEVYPENRWNVSDAVIIPADTHEKLQDQNSGGSGWPDDILLKDAPLTVKKALKTRGRPRKTGSDVSRTTKWRRLKESMKEKTELLI